MRAFQPHSAWWVALVLVIAVILGILAFLQYRWIGEVSEADLQRTQINLETAVGQFLEDFYTELLHVCLEFRPEPGAATARDWSLFAARYEVWRRTARRPRLVSDLLVWEANSGGKPRLLGLNRNTLQIEPVAWPPALQHLESSFVSKVRAVRPYQRDPRLFAWTIDEDVPALLHPLVAFSSPQGDSGQPAIHLVGFLVVELSRDYLRDRLLPELVSQHFGGLGSLVYGVEIIDPQGPERLIYRPDPSIPYFPPSAADISVKLVGQPVGELVRLSLAVSAATRDQNQPIRRPPALLGTPVITPEHGEGRWTLAVKYRAGSLAAVVTPLRRRNLALSFGVLLLLAISMALILIFTRRAQRLAKLQMNFVAGVSHELRTPLAVICSAGDNLADGIVDPSPPVKEYGELIRNEGRRLVGMVEQILQFSAAKPRSFDLRPVEISGPVAATLVDAAPLIEKAGVSVEMDVEPGLAPALVDEQALKQCLLNLISNAVKYGGESRWLAVRARQASRNGSLETQVTVEDRGPGIDQDELRQIFQPFYRGTVARLSPARGTGLGLSLTKELVEAMGGRITVESAPGRGTAFTLHFPAART